MSSAFTRAGFRTFSARNGRVALQILRAAKPDLLVTDIVMPEMEGLATIREAKQASPGTRVVAISGGGQYARHDRFLTWAEGLGADEVLAKPFKISSLLTAARLVLDPRRPKPNRPPLNNPSINSPISGRERPMRILLVEDDRTLCRTIELTLLAKGFIVEIARTGEDAVEFGEVYDFDLILLDLDLPDLSGLEVLRTLRRSRVTTPIVIITGSEGVDTKVKAPVQRR